MLKILNRGHSNIFDAHDVKNQDVYEPYERLEGQNSFLNQSSSNFSTKSKKLKKFNTNLSSHISV